MEMLEHIENCLEQEEAFCTAACPFHLDGRAFCERISKGRFRAAYQIYRNAVGFPRIACAICEENCRNFCARKDFGGAVEMKRLEQACLAYSGLPEPARYHLPKKQQNVAVIGAGISGLAFALRMAEKGYPVTVFEKSSRIGGELWERLDPDLFLEEIRRQFCYAPYDLCLNHEITEPNPPGYDVTYLATGAGGEAFGLLGDVERETLATSREGVFLGGSLMGGSLAEALADGLAASQLAEHYLKTGRMDRRRPPSETRVALDTRLLQDAPAVEAASEEGAYDDREAAREAGRCLGCRCDACQKHCDLMNYYRKYPQVIQDEVCYTIHPASLDGNGTLAKRLIGTCNQCGFCREVCPEEIDLEHFLLESRRAMQKNGSLPWVYHDFWLRDLAFSQSSEASLLLRPRSEEPCRYLFFPGCQLGASDPRYVTESYRFLREREPGTALLLSCCGAPAVWAGEQEKQEEVFLAIKKTWMDLGKPVVILACPTCRKIFREYLPDITCDYLYPFLLEQNCSPKRSGDGRTVSVFDSCSSRREAKLQQAVRDLTVAAGYSLQPLLYERENAKCCGWGGHVSFANPDYLQKAVKERITQASQPYVTYCVNCRDTFAEAGKPVVHILDVLWDLGNESRPAPDINERRENRRKLKRMALLEWGEKTIPSARLGALICSPEVRKKLGREHLIEEEAESAVLFCERTGRRLRMENGNFSGYAMVGRMTYWVEYRPEGSGYRLENAYAHRMEIAREEIWNGKRQEGPGVDHRADDWASSETAGRKENED
ncbi:heterodisulfide reductase-related iron-sulfur binding cluster [Cuneatibacter sp. NSJ-177]|nr:heterodisulfide reductase-related iron-sulfur binding cluster [Cuneatibacter sp. NSJ-177]